MQNDTFSTTIILYESYTAALRMLLKPWHPLKTDQWQDWEQETCLKKTVLESSTQDFESLEIENHPNDNPRNSCGQQMHWVVEVGWGEQLTLIPGVVDGKVGLLGKIYVLSG